MKKQINIIEKLKKEINDAPKKWVIVECPKTIIKEAIEVIEKQRDSIKIMLQLNVILSGFMALWLETKVFEKPCKVDPSERIINPKETKRAPFEKVEEKFYGKKGTKKRNAYERTISKELSDLKEYSYLLKKIINMRSNISKTAKK